MKLEHFYNSLGEPVEANNGDFGYFVTVGDLLENGGKNEFFRKVKGGKVSRNVYCDLEYDRSEKTWYADCYTDVSAHSGALKKNMIVFIGFDF